MSSSTCLRLLGCGQKTGFGLTNGAIRWALPSFNLIYKLVLFEVPLLDSHHEENSPLRIIHAIGRIGGSGVDVYTGGDAAEVVELAEKEPKHDNVEMI